MEFTSKKESDFFLAVASSVFALCFIFLGTKLSKWYHLIGFMCLIVGIRYWVKVKKDNLEQEQL